MHTPIVQRIINILIVRRPELTGKWWHRLANVLIYGSSIIFMFLLFGEMFSVKFEFKNIFIALFFILSWFIFWESILYRSIIYIIYGGNK